jgi:hypothetical protein
MKIKVEKDKSVLLKSLYQWETYAGLLEGIPSNRLNERIISRALEKAKELCQVQNPYLIQPEQTLIDLQRPSEFGLSAKLPSYICIGELWYHDPIKNQKMDYSTLGVLWFQDEFALPIEEKILRVFESLPWSEVAEDCSF